MHGMNQGTFITKTANVKRWVSFPNAALLILFSILWLSDCFLTVYATHNGYVESWNSWTRLITRNSYIFIPVKFMTLGMVIGIVRWANSMFPYVIFFALVLFDTLVGTVLAANIITLINA